MLNIKPDVLIYPGRLSRLVKQIRDIMLGTWRPRR